MVDKLIFVFAVFFSLLFFGCVVQDNITDTNPAINSEGLTIKQSTVGRFGDLSIGVVSVQNDSARISAWIGSDSQTFDIAVGEEISFQEYLIKNLEVYVSPVVAVMPGSSEDYVTLNITQVS